LTWLIALTTVQHYCANCDDAPATLFAATRLRSRRAQ